MLDDNSVRYIHAIETSFIRPNTFEKIKKCLVELDEEIKAS